MNQDNSKTNQKIYKMVFATVYPLYIAKVERKGRTKAEVDEVISWLTGYDQHGLKEQLEKQVNMETFVAQAPKLNPARSLINGVICGIRVEDIKDHVVQTVRYMDKLVDEVAKGRPMEKILRK